jgi:single-strand DNA-binding protein
MYETMVPIIGRVITEPALRTVSTGDKLCSFRMLAKERRFNRETQEWGDGDKLFLNVTCWRKLAENAKVSLFKGDDIVVYGRLYLNEYETASGEPKSSIELDAKAIGPDLSRCSVLIQRTHRDSTLGELAATPSALAA